MDWEATSLSNFMVKHPEVRRVKGGTKLACFDVSDALKLVASIQLIKPKIRHSVFRVLQGSGSINEKLLEFVAATE
jgi:hypothetical protein